VTLALVVLTQFSERMDTNLVMDAGVALIGIVALASLGLLWRLNDRVGEMNSILSHPQLGLVALWQRLDERLRAVEDAVAGDE
jgi:hypothetical protein